MPMYSACGNAALPALGFPIRESADHRLFSAYPRLIAAVHALHRLQVPRHPPCALHILTVITHSDSASKRAVIPVSLAKLCSFQGPCKSGAGGTRRRSLKTQQHAGHEARELVPVIPVHWLSLCSFQGPWRGLARGLRTPVSQNSTACRRTRRRGQALSLIHI